MIFRAVNGFACPILAKGRKLWAGRGSFSTRPLVCRNYGHLPLSQRPTLATNLSPAASTCFFSDDILGEEGQSSKLCYLWEEKSA